MSLLKTLPKDRYMLTAVTATAATGALVGSLIRLDQGMSLDVPLQMVKVLVPILAVAWVWHIARWPGLLWIESTLYVSMATAVQTVMEVNVTGALLVVPVLGIVHRHRGVTLYSAALGTVAFGWLLLHAPLPIGGGSPLLQFGAHAILQATLAAVYLGIIRLATRAEQAHAKMTEQMAMQWAASIEARDHYTGGHGDRVTQYAMELAPMIPNLGMSLQAFRLACVLHDVGKISVPDHILNKPGKLTPEEYQTMQRHAEVGYNLVFQTDAPLDVALVVRHHHEWWDGSGYPDGLQAREIPLAARVLAVADAFDAITSKRPYRPALSPEEARDLIVANAGTQFDPQVVAAFLRQFDQWVRLYRSSTAQGPHGGRIT